MRFPSKTDLFSGWNQNRSCGFKCFPGRAWFGLLTEPVKMSYIRICQVSNQKDLDFFMLLVQNLSNVIKTEKDTRQRGFNGCYRVALWVVFWNLTWTRKASAILILTILLKIWLLKDPSSVSIKIKRLVAPCFDQEGNVWRTDTHEPTSYINKWFNTLSKCH